MTEKLIRIRGIEDAKKFVAAVKKFNYDIDLCCGSYDVDAKSILGILSLDLTQVLMVRYNHDMDPVLEEALNCFAA